MEIKSALLYFSKKEKIVFFGFLIVFIVSAILILENINKSFMANIPLRGGSLREGVIGTPRFINPILASSTTDEDLVTLIYSGLMRKNQDGTLIPDLAEKYEMSKNGLVYTFTLKDKIYFQDGKPVTTSDVIFTINKIKDATLKSPRKVNWDGVSVASVDAKTIEFTLKQPYASFLENTTLGIMPLHLWKNSPIELNETNTSPVGSGPYMVKSVDKKSSGIINHYELTSFKKFILGEPYIKKINLYFYPKEEDMLLALQNQEIEQVSSITPLNAETLKKENHQVHSTVLPRVFGLYFNQNQNQLFTDKAIISAINQAIDKDKIVAEILFGYGTAIGSPIPPNMKEYQKPVEKETRTREKILGKVKADLAKAGWKTGEDGFLEKVTKDKKTTKTTKLEFSISTGNVEELAKAAELIKENLKEIGIKVDVKNFEIGNLNQNVIRPRKYDSLLFGQIINHESDLFAFWHSSQRKDPGLNIAMYTNVKVDKILEDAFVTVDETARINKYIQFSDEIKKDVPAVFLYSPDFIYVTSKNLQGLNMEKIISPADRYSSVYSWYIQTENVWKIFAK